MLRQYYEVVERSKNKGEEAKYEVSVDVDVERGIFPPVIVVSELIGDAVF